MKNAYYTLLMAVMILVLHSCASMGRPTGGPVDVLPPIYVQSSPEQGATNVKDRKIEIVFDELVNLKDQNDKVVVSPAQRENASIRTSGRKVLVELRDSLLPNTTYTVDFSDAIEDYTEGNPVEGFSFAFSTGNVVDSLQISGMVLGARNLEPQQKILVGVHSNLNDSAFSKIKLERIARTNDRGQFTIRNLKPGKYHLFALNDVDRDYKWAVTEDMAFYGGEIEPWVERSEVSDTIYNVRHEVDTVVSTVKSRFYPNDVLLSMFNEEKKAQYLLNTERVEKRKFQILFAAPADTLPKIELVGMTPVKDRWCVVERSEHNDTINYWITDSTVYNCDTIRVAASFLRTDSLQELSMGTDTLTFVNKKFIPKKRKDKDEKADSVALIKFLGLKVESPASQDIHLPVYLSVDAPLDSVNQSGVHLDVQKDSVWVDAGMVKLEPMNEYSKLKFRVDYDWEAGAEYRLQIDSAMVYSVYGLFNKPLEHKFKMKEFEDYSVLSFVVTGVRDSAIVELLDGQDKVVRTAPIEGGRAVIEYINPGTYYARLFIDSNGNGKYDTGNYGEHRQPEDVYYYHKKLVLKKNWDVTENWDINMFAIDKQKPIEITKNKPTKKKWEKSETDTKKATDEEDLYDEYNNPFGGNQYQQNNNYNPFSPSRR